jgi:hypothetical protein
MSSYPRDRRPSPVGSVASSQQQAVIRHVPSAASSSSRQPTPNAYAEAFRHMHKTEKIVRLEVQRRSIRDVMKVHDEIIEGLDAQLAYVADFKREWLTHMQRLESERLDLLDVSVKEREALEAGWLSGTESILAAMSPARQMGGGASSSFRRRGK